ncbi:MAG: RibD family protein [Verrucomicrobiales bacterium]|nr:RibD family protein [Verrucomicrobiales bacterium]
MSETNPKVPKRPWVVVNMAMSADGKVASANRRVTRIGSDQDLEALYALRSTADAILCGARTVEETNATLGNGGERHRRNRRRRGLQEFPLRIVASAAGSLSSKAELWRHSFSPIIVLVTPRASASRIRRLRRLANDVVTYAGDPKSLGTALARLAARRGIRRLVVEGGGILNAALFAADCVDEIHLTLCPLLMGGRTAPSIADGPGFAELANAKHFKLVSAKPHGRELFTVYLRVGSESRKPGGPTRGRSPSGPS